MNTQIRYYIIVTKFYLLLLCLSAAPAVAKDCLVEIEELLNVKLQKHSMRYATRFKIFKAKGVRLIEVKTPWQGSKRSYQYILTKNGYLSLKICRGVQRIFRPVKAVVSMSTTHLPFLDLLGVTNRLRGFSNTKFVNNKNVLKFIASGAIKEVGYPPNPEIIYTLMPDLIIAYASESPALEGVDRLLKLGLPVVYNAEYLEKTPLARAEWIVFMGALFNKEEVAQKAFEGIEKRYLSLKKLTEKVKLPPTVLIGKNYNGIWHAPGGKSDLATLVADAGGAYLWREDNSRNLKKINFEAVFSLIPKVSVWLPQSTWRSFKDALLEDSRYNNFKKLLIDGTIYNINGNINNHGGNDFYETGLMRPDLLLKDLIKILHPDLLPSHKLRWYKKF
ncbi:MAG: ABC transporter substrate-binding protein [Bacteriovoracaceae bacterium]|nr:ABC transporter substrate-binding protein [Bacteriovoracaceae bacterium]